ncbi:unnamed protein product [Lepeophtheirus salmonis]|nr:unnamed protein product [Lepeophtheirus salmonis]CAF2753531.1 unnamed protein product [Lepeophtheirus salmonis]
MWGHNIYIIKDFRLELNSTRINLACYLQESLDISNLISSTQEPTPPSAPPLPPLSRRSPSELIYVRVIERSPSSLKPPFKSSMPSASSAQPPISRRVPNKGGSQSSSRNSSHNSSVASIKSTSSTSSPSMGTSSFMVGRERDRSAEMEMFSQSRKPRSNYRRPSNLGLSTTPLPNKTESNAYCARAVSRDHIVKAIPDHLKLEGDFEKSTELKANFRNLSPARPIIFKIKDHLKPEGDLFADSESSTQYRNLKPARPIIHRMRDHAAYVQPQGGMMESSEYRGSFQKSMVRGDRAAPDWITNFAKVTIDGGDSTRQ